MKKRLIVILLLIMIFPMILLSSCRTECKSHSDYIMIDYKMPTCTEEGYVKAKCGKCGEIVTETTPARHDIVSEEVIERATCGKSGKKAGYCINCQQIVTYDYEDSNSHDYTVKYYISEPTCKEYGVYSYKCEYCDKIMSIDGVNPKEHYEEPLKHDYYEGVCKKCNDLKVYNIKYVINGTVFYEREFNKDTFASIKDPTYIDYPGINFISWKDYTFNYEDIVVEANVEYLKYNIKYFDMDGADNPNPTSYTIKDNIELANPTKKGHEFIGWYDEYGNKITSINVRQCKDLKIYAKWEIKQYEIRIFTNPIFLHINDGNRYDIDLTKIPDYYTINDVKNIELPELNLGGYTFEGWYIRGTNEKITYIDIKKLESVDIVASFIPIQYKIILDSEYVKYPEHDVAFGDWYRLEPVKINGYKFIGWFDGETKLTDETGVCIDEFGYFNDVTLQPKLELIEYDINLSCEYDIELPEIPKTYNVESETIELPELSNDGYEFVGWTNKFNGEYITEITKGSYGNITIEPIIKPNKYVIKFMIDENSLYELNINYGTSYSVVLSTPNKIGYQFVGWYLDDTLVADANGTSIESYKYTTDIILNGKYELIEYPIFVTSNIDFDFSNFNLPESYNYESEEMILPRLEKEGYTFEGYLLDNETYIDKISNMVGALNLEAKFTPNKYIINLSSGTSVEVSYDGSYYIPALEKEGHTFIGWYKDDVAYTDKVGRSLENYKDISDIELEAKYTVNKYTIKYYKDGELLQELTYDYGTTVTNIVPEKISGSIFIGWYDKNDNCSSDEFIIKKDIELYAKYDVGFEISTVEDWNLIKENPSANFALVNDINFKEKKLDIIEEFSGNLNGNGYAIRNFSIGTDSVDSLYGLFKKNNGIIKNLKIESFTGNLTLNQKSNCNVGILIAENNGTLDNIKINDATVSVTTVVTNYSLKINIGMIVGVNKGTINETFANIDGQFTTNMNQNNNNTGKTYYRIGGLCSINTGNITYSGVNTSINVTQKTTGSLGGGMIRILSFAHTINTLGGLVGQNASSGSIDSSYANVNLKYTSNTTHYYATSSSGSGLLHTDKLNMGGLVGENIDSAEILNSYTSGSISGSSNVSVSHSGGLVGSNDGSASIRSCYAMTSVTSSGTQYDGETTFAGFVGYNNATIANCYSTGNVASSVNSSVGGFAGHNNNGGTISKSYSTGNVIASSGYSHKFAGRSSGIIKKVYSITTNTYTQGGSQNSNYNSVYEEIDFSSLLSDKYLKEQLFWDEEGWYTGIDGNPFLKWELDYSHDFKETKVEPTCLKPGYTLYECQDCGKIFLKDIKEPLGHEPQGPAYQVIEPTHTTEGYEKYICKHTDSCDNENLEYVVKLDALGHDEVHEIECNDLKLENVDGKYKYTCSCGEKLEIDEMIVKHSPKNVSYKAPSCSSINSETGEKIEAESGRTQGSICSLCDKVLFGCLEIKPHNLELKETIIEANCDTEGEALYVCTICNDELLLQNNPLGHKYTSDSYACVTCGKDQFTIDDSYYAIEEPEDLNMLTNNPFGYYYLNADLDLTEYTFNTLCSVKTPFDGILLGNGYKIKNLIINSNNVSSVDQAFIASIGENGVVAGLVFENVYVSVKASVTDKNIQNSSALITNNVGIVTAHNYGKIYRCSVTGDIDVRITSQVINNSTSDVSKFFYYTYGTFAAHNYESGSIVEAVVKGNFNLSYTFEASLKSNSVSSAMQHILSVTNAGNITELISGGIVGLNKGYISNTSFESTTYHAISRISDVQDRGKSSLIVNLYDGAFVGMNYGQIVGSKSKIINNNIHSADYDAYEYDNPLVVGKVIIQSMYMKITDYTVFSKNPGIIGFNSKNSSYDIETLK